MLVSKPQGCRVTRCMPKRPGLYDISPGAGGPNRVAARRCVLEWSGSSRQEEGSLNAKLQVVEPCLTSGNALNGAASLQNCKAQRSAVDLPNSLPLLCEESLYSIVFILITTHIQGTSSTPVRWVYRLSPEFSGGCGQGCFCALKRLFESRGWVPNPSVFHCERSLNNPLQPSLAHQHLRTYLIQFDGLY